MRIGRRKLEARPLRATGTIALQIRASPARVPAIVECDIGRPAPCALCRFGARRPLHGGHRPILRPGHRSADDARGGASPDRQLREREGRPAPDRRAGRARPVTVGQDPETGQLGALRGQRQRDQPAPGLGAAGAGDAAQPGAVGLHDRRLPAHAGLRPAEVLAALRGHRGLLALAGAQAGLRLRQRLYGRLAAALGPDPDGDGASAHGGRGRGRVQPSGTTDERRAPEVRLLPPTGHRGAGAPLEPAGAAGRRVPARPGSVARRAIFPAGRRIEPGSDRGRCGRAERT